MRLRIFAVILAAAILACPASSASRAEVIKLDNGFEMVLVESRFVPMVASIVAVKTGVRNETAEINGVSHLLEHLLFNGTEKRTQKELYDEIELLGLYNNAFTRTDCTVFLILSHRDHFAQALDIQADMLLRSTIPADKVPKEKGIVVNELKSDGMGFRSMDLDPAEHNAALFEGTPYAMDVMGSIESVTAVSRDRIYEYYKHWYRPCNMTALVMGDFDRDSVVALYRSLFGGSQPGGGIADVQAPAAPWLEKTRVLVREGNGPDKTICATVAAAHPREREFLALQAGAAVLNAADSKRIEDALAVYGCSNFALEHGFNRDHAWLTAKLQVDAAADHTRVVAALFESMRSLSAGDFSEEALRRAAVAEEAQEAFNMERLHFYGMLKAPVLAVLPFERLAAFVGDGYIAGLKKVDPSAAAAAVAACFEPKADGGDPHALISVYEPPAAGGDAAASIPGVRESSWEETVLNGRRTARFELENGLTAVVEESAGSGVFAAHILFKNRTFHEPPGKEGITDFLHRILPLGGGGLTGEELENRFEKIGAGVKYHDLAFIPHDDYYTTPFFSYIRLQTLERFAAEGMNLLAGVIERPALNAENVARARKATAHLARQASQKVGLRAKKEFLETLFPGSFISGSVVGTPDSIDSITLEDLEEHHRRYFSPGNMIVTAASALPVNAAAGIIAEAFGRLPPGPALEEPPASLTPAGRGVVETVVEGDPSYVIYGYAFDYGAARRDALDVAVDLFSSAVTFQWREVEGGAYEMGASYGSYGDAGWFWTRIETTSNPQDALAAVRSCIEEFKSKAVTEAEVLRSINSLTGWRLMKVMTREGRAYHLAMGELRGQGAADEGAAPSAPCPEAVALPVPIN